MTVFWMTVCVLLAAAAGLLLAGGRKPQPSTRRDALNTEFYHQRLRELEEDEAQGVVAGRAEMVRELQQTLLLDIPQNAPVDERRAGRRVLLPGALVLLVVSLGFYFKTGGYMQVVAWRQIQDDLPALRAQVMNPQAKPLSPEALARLGLGIRTSLQQNPHSLSDWLMLGRIGMVLNNAAMATQAFHRAMQLAPDNPDVQLSYAEVLTRSDDPGDVRQAGELLEAMEKHDGNNLRLLSQLAFNAFAQQRYDRAIVIWQKMLQLLPAEDRRAEMIRRSIGQARSESAARQAPTDN
ncbi:c-type cytochrome biogenesis protein CcmI [Erwinia sp. 9145]|uniref:c-type cytochrome biogenesis protein CcmI n=1 Tax=Erwinia sp. 9145 TaxID=1500895 RepID=UPI000690BD06|nr:c-type cytochrome biogenesis protein CcmI [Erwinia sp. 9145]